MDFEDIVLIIVLVLGVISDVLSRRGKQTLKPNRKSKPLANPDVGNIRKQTKTPRRRDNANAPPSRSYRSQLNVPRVPVKRKFSAYKHLPKQTTAEESVPDATVCRAKPSAPAVCEPVSYLQKDIADKKTKLREWIIGQVILDTPAFRKSDGNFFHR